MTATHGILALDGVSKVFQARRGLFDPPRRVWAAKHVSLCVARKEAFGLVGESGSGKTTLARLMVGLLKPTSGRVLFDGADLARLPEGEIRRMRRSLQMIFQDPVSALDPRQSVFRALAEVLRVRGIRDRRTLCDRVEAVLETVDLRPEDAGRYPHELSGGQCQRVGIARALISTPSVLVADEPVSQLDVSTQAQIVSLLGRLRECLGLTVVLVAHDLSVVRQAVDRVAVMLGGWIVEIASTAEIFSRPLHPYTRALLDAVPRPGRARRPAAGTDAGGGGAPGEETGCPFFPRCPQKKTDCGPGPVELVAAGTRSHYVRCLHVRGSADP